MPSLKSYQVTILGRVQNVGFRYHTKEKAEEFGINGFVMNQSNGNVYIEAEGSEESIRKFLDWCHQGPNWANVREVKAIEQPICNFNTFEIRR